VSQLKVCVLSSGHSPRAARLVQEAQTLVQAGYSVLLIGPGTINVADSPYREFISICPADKRSSRLSRLVRLFRFGLRQTSSMYHAHELDSLLVALMLGKLNHAPVVFDCHEYHAEAITENRFKNRHLRGMAYALIDRLEAWMARRCQTIISVNDDLTRRFARLGCHSVTLPNYPTRSITETNPIPEEVQLRLENHLVLVYAGKLSEARGISIAIRVVAKLVPAYPSLRLLLLGRASTVAYAQRLNNLIQELGVGEHVLWVGQVPQKDVFGYLKHSDVGLFLLRPVKERYNLGEPIKMFEYAAAGLPVIVSDLPAKRRLVDKMRNGFLVDPANEDAVASSIVRLLSDTALRLELGENGRRAFRGEFNWESVEKRLLDLYAGPREEHG